MATESTEETENSIVKTLKRSVGSVDSVANTFLIVPQRTASRLTGQPGAGALYKESISASQNSMHALPLSI
jgi:hypothetical protein